MLTISYASLLLIVLIAFGAGLLSPIFFILYRVLQAEIK